MTKILVLTAGFGEGHNAAARALAAALDREAGPGTDFHATSNGEVSITPLHVDLTDHATLPAWREWAGRAAG